MKLTKILTCFAAIAMVALGVSCEKGEQGSDYGLSKIYMPQAITKSAGVNNDYPVPSGTDTATYNYKVDAASGKVKVILGASVSGAATDGFTVDIVADNDTVQKMLSQNILNSQTHMLMPASMYSMPSQLVVPAGQKAATFDLSLDIAALKSSTYANKFLVLAVKIQNPTKFELNKALATTILILDVKALTIGPAVNITNQYIQNPGFPYVASAKLPSNQRWGTLGHWKTNAPVLNHNGYGGWENEAGGNMNMESGWGSPQIHNGKIWQTFTLPAGRYTYDMSDWIWQGTKDPGYVVVAPNVDELPDYGTIVGNTSIWYVNFSNGKVDFTLSTATKVSVGVVVNYTQTEQGFKSRGVNLFSYPKAL